MGSTAIEKANARLRAKAFACEDASADPIGSAFAFPLPLVTLADFLAGRAVRPDPLSATANRAFEKRLRLDGNSLSAKLCFL